MAQDFMQEDRSNWCVFGVARMHEYHEFLGPLKSIEILVSPILVVKTLRYPGKEHQETSFTGN